MMNTHDNSMTRRTALLAGAGAAVASMALAGTARAAVRGSAGPRALTPAQQAGQRVIYSYSGLTVPQALLNQIAAGQAAGVIFFGENISSISQIKSVCQQLNAANQSSPVTAPLLLMTDQEGGQVRRLPGGPDASEKEIGASSDPAGAASDAGTTAGQLLKSAGMNVNLAPVLDVFRTPGDFEDQYERSYSQDPDICGQCGSAFVSAQQSQGVAAAVKHFPGLGSATASQNTDNKPVTLNASASTLRSVDEAPYAPAIAAGVDMVMMSWAVYPALDASNPAGLSSKIISQELRSRLGFQGVTVTDSITAGALGAYGTPSQRSVLAAKAGMDLILACGGNTNGTNIVNGMAAALQNGTLSQSSFDAARNRVTALRNRL